MIFLLLIKTNVTDVMWVGSVISCAMCNYILTPVSIAIMHAMWYWSEFRTGLRFGAHRSKMMVWVRGESIIDFVRQ